MDKLLLDNSIEFSLYEINYSNSFLTDKLHNEFEILKALGKVNQIILKLESEYFYFFPLNIE